MHRAPATAAAEAPRRAATRSGTAATPAACGWRGAGGGTRPSGGGREPVWAGGGGGGGGGGGASEGDEIRPTGHSINVGQSVSGRITRNDELWVDSTYM